MDIVKLETEITKRNEQFCGEVRGMTTSQLKDRLAAESLQLQEINIFIDTNKELNVLKYLAKEANDRLKEAMKPSKDAIKFQKQKIEFLVVNLEEKTIK